MSEWHCNAGRTEKQGHQVPHTHGWKPGKLLKWVDIDFGNGDGRHTEYSAKGAKRRPNIHLDESHPGAPSIDWVYPCGCWSWGCQTKNDSRATVYGWEEA